jgi:hypothetical protein
VKEAMDCSDLPGFLEGDLAADRRDAFEHHVADCAACQAELEAAMQLAALGAEVALRPDRPRAVPYLPDAAERRGAGLRDQPRAAPGPRRLRWLGTGALAVAAVIALVLAMRPPAAPPSPEDEIVASLGAARAWEDRLPYAPLDHHRAYSPSRAGPGAPAEAISSEAVIQLGQRKDPGGLIAANIARGDLVSADALLQKAGPGDDLDVERAVVAARRGQATAALAVLDRVLDRNARHAQALWNRAVVLGALDLPLAAAEAFGASAALAEPGWSTEAAARRDELTGRERARIEHLKDAVRTCNELGSGALPDLAVASRYPYLCRPSLYVAVRRAHSREDAQRLLPIARAIDAASGDTASSALIERVAAADFAARGKTVALYERITAQPPPAGSEQARIVAQLRSAGPAHADLLLGALLRVQPQTPDTLDELVRVARAAHDPYFDELATEKDADAKLATGRALEAEVELREAVARCAPRDVELRCTYLQMKLIEQYLARHRPTDAAEVATVALQRTRRLGLNWAERVLFDFLSDAARYERDFPQMRAYLREAALRSTACDQQLGRRESLADAEVAELQFARARRELDQAPPCTPPMSLIRAQTEAELARFDGTPERTAALRGELDRTRRETATSAGQRALIDAIEGRLLSASDAAGARALLRQAIAAADALRYDDVEGTKARTLAYRTLLVLGAGDLDPEAELALFAAAARVPRRPGCALGALIDGERLVLVARDAHGQLHPVFEPRAFTTPDFDARAVVPAAIVGALAGCPRVDVLALAPLYGQPRLLPPELAWSYRGPAGTPPPPGAGRRSVLTIEDTRPPAALGLPRLQSPSHEPRGSGIDEIVLGGAEATPHRVRRELPAADLAEFHAHGFVDLGISDVSLIALSTDLDGSFALTARVIAGLHLARAPFIALAACDAAYTAPYLHEPWSLPYAFLLAGARGVLAPATAVPDRDAGSFFRTVGDQILRGLDPAAVLRDQRMQRRAAADWVDAVVLFD